MSVSSQINASQHIGTDALTPLSTQFVFVSDTDIKVVQRDTGTGGDTTLTLGIHYSVTGGGTVQGIPKKGTVTPLRSTSGVAIDFRTFHRWTLQRRMPKTQPVVYVENDPFPAKSHEGALDRVTLIAQDASAERSDGASTQDRALLIPEGDPITISTTLPDSVTRAGKVLTFNGLGEPEATDLTTLIATADVSLSTATATGTSEARQLRERFAEVINVKDFGADGNDSTDDTLAIQAAIDLAEAATFGASVFFPDGVYRHTGLVINLGNVELFGTGHKSILRLVDDTEPANNGCIFIDVAPVATSEAVRIRDLQIDGRSGTITGAPTEDTDGIHIRRAISVDIRGVFIKDVGRDGIFVEPTVALGVENQQKASIVDCVIDDAGRYGISGYRLLQSKIRECKIEDPGDHFILLSGSTDSLLGPIDALQVVSNQLIKVGAPTRTHLSVTGTDGSGIFVTRTALFANVFSTQLKDNYITNPNDFGILIQTGSTITVSGNEIQLSGVEAIAYIDDLITGVARDLVITGNVCKDANRDNAATTGTIKLGGAGTGTLNGVAITNNVASNSSNADYGLHIDSATMNFSDVLVDGNLFEQVGISSLSLIGTQITQLMLGSGNKFIAGQLYGETQLAGTPGIKSENAVGMPDGLAMVATVTRTTPTGALGHLAATYDTPNSKVDIASDDNETSLVYWRVLGTLDAL